jgi:hypothetical protein
LKLSGCLANHLRTLLNQLSPPLDQNFAHFKIQMNFGRIHQISLFSLLSSSFLFQLDQGGTPAGHSLSLSLFPLSYPLGHKGWGKPEAILQRLHSISLSHPQPPSTPNQHQATAQMNPRTPPASACSAPATLPLPRGRSHPEPTHANQGSVDKPAPAIAPLTAPSHRRPRPIICCRPCHPLATP